MNPDQIMASLDAGRLSEEQAADLLAALRDDPDQRRKLAGEWRVHRTLLMIADKRADERLVASLRLARPARLTKRFVASVRKRIDGRRRFWRYWLAAAAVAAALLAAIGLPHPQAQNDQGLAVVVSTTGGRIADRAARPDERIAAGTEVVGPLVLVWTTEPTRLELAADASVRLSAGVEGKRVALAHGKVTIEAAPQPASSPLVVTAPLGRATVVGTRFTLTSSASRLGLDVAEGEVRLADLSGRGVSVTAGRTAEIRAGVAPSLVSGPALEGRRILGSDFTRDAGGWSAALATATLADWKAGDECRWKPIGRAPDPSDAKAQTLRLSSDMPAQWFARQFQQSVRHPGVRMRLLVVGPLTGRRFFADLKDSRQRDHRVALDIRETGTWLTVTAEWPRAADPLRPWIIDTLYVGEEFDVGVARSIRTVHLGQIELLDLHDAASP